jgi:hypothetical protein
MKAKTAALLIGVVFIAIGLLGFVDNPIVGDSDKAIFHADTLHNWVHIISGMLLSFVALAAPGSASMVLMVFGVVYALIGVVGFVSVGSEGMGKVLGFLHVNGADNYLHVVLGIVIFISGVASRRVSATV